MRADGGERARRDARQAPYMAPGRRDDKRLAPDLAGGTQEEFSAAFKGSPMKRAKLRGLDRSAKA